MTATNDQSVQRWPISYLLEELFVAAMRYVVEPSSNHALEVEACRERVTAELAKRGQQQPRPRPRDVKIAREIAAERRAGDRLAGRCLCWRCGESRRQQGDATE